MEPGGRAGACVPYHANSQFQIFPLITWYDLVRSPFLASDFFFTRLSDARRLTSYPGGSDKL